MMANKVLKPAKSFGEISVALTFRTGTVGDSDPKKVVAHLFEDLVKGFQESERLKLWGIIVEKVRYEPFKKTAGGPSFEYEPPRRQIRLDQ